MPSPPLRRTPVWLVAVVAVLMACGSGLDAAHAGSGSKPSPPTAIQLLAGAPGQAAMLASRSGRDFELRLAQRPAPDALASSESVRRGGEPGTLIVSAVVLAGGGGTLAPIRRRGPPSPLA